MPERSAASDDCAASAAPRDRSAPVLPLRIKMAYAQPRFTIRAATVIIQVYGQLYYMQLGAKLRFMAFYTAIGRALDVITDPAMGWLTDSTRSRLGRRKPYLIFGMFFYMLILGGLFHPPRASSDALTHWYGVCYCLFFAIDTFSNVPYYALGMELTSDYVQRNSLYFWQHVMGQAGTMIGGVMPAILSDFGLSLRDAYATTGWSFGAWYFFGIAAILILIKEREAPKAAPDSAAEDSPPADVAGDAAAEGGDAADAVCAEQPPQQSVYLQTRAMTPPLVREMLRIYRNEAFMPWMTAYILDYAAVGILATMVPLFSQYVLVEPDSSDCEQQCFEWNPEHISCTCATLATEWLGWIMASTFLAGMVSVPFWHWVANRLTKHRAWLIYSWWNALTAPLRIMCGKGNLGLSIALSAINGSAFGGQFIGESVMADLSDYDEFLYGDRAEGMLGVIATLGPKMVLTVCFVIPLATIASAGFRESIWPAETIDNFASGLVPCVESEFIDACPKIPQPQNSIVLWITRVGVSVVPTLLALASNYFKCKFPLKNKHQMDEILEGVELHQRGQPAKDPISGKMVTIVRPRSVEEQKIIWALEMWGATAGGRGGCLHQVLSMNALQGETTLVHMSSWRCLRWRAWSYVAYGAVLTVASVAGAVATFPLLEQESTSWIPTSLCICCGAMVVFTTISLCRLRVALHLSRAPVRVALMRALLSRAAGTLECGKVAKLGPSMFGKDFGEVVAKAPPEELLLSEAPPAPAVLPKHLACDDLCGEGEAPAPESQAPAAAEVDAASCPWQGARPRRASSGEAPEADGCASGEGTAEVAPERSTCMAI
eukprot:TRINITY_DN54133_c0_g1_i1.p1 TRINITY_DN54133_c0_g1~~TRINITY_DN54133_c0_g1_i1.p1  ORF type:complete len:831 (+),score=171.70 TRINITY_DN54133_c0_g1_i1:76-2568(+)